MTSSYWFDLDGTLVTYEVSFAQLLAETLGDEPSEAHHETFRRRLFTAFETFESNPYRRGFEALAEDHDLSVDPATAARDYRERELQASTLATGATTVLEHVSTMGSIGILTNGNGEMQRAKLEYHGLEDHADAIIISNEVEVRKPDPGIFELAKERLPADRHVYVGDTYEEDIQPALDAGFVPIHVRHDRGPPVSVATLEGLLALTDDRAEGH